MKRHLNQFKPSTKNFDKMKPSPHIDSINKEEIVRMDYDSYVILRDLLDAAMVKFENDFRMACSFIPLQPLVEIRKDIPSGIEKAHKIFSEHYTKLRKAKIQLHIATESTYKDHPNKKMREFWGLIE